MAFNVFAYLVNRAKEPSTIAGVGVLATALGVAIQNGATKDAFLSAAAPIVLGLFAAAKADIPKAVGTPVDASVGPVVALSDQVASMATEMAKISAAVSLAAPVVAAVAPVVRDTIGK